MKENLYTPNSIRTYSGLYFNVVEPSIEMISIEDIAHSLAYQCRFGGHIPKFYSVAQHSIECSYEASKEKKLEALLHDASEAYLLDIPKPIKVNLPDYVKLEETVMGLISEKFGIGHPICEEVKEIDRRMLEYEWETIMLEKNKSTQHYVEFLSPQRAKNLFMKEFKKLSN